MEKMFYNCNSLTSLDISNFKSNYLYNVKNMFELCTSLKTIDLSFLNKGRGIMFFTGMFKNCTSLEKITVPMFDSFFLYYTDEMFYGCTNLTNIDLSAINTLSVRNMEKMFYDCTSLKNLDISKFNTRSLEKFDYIFEGIEDSDSFNIKYNGEKIKELSSAIKKNWTVTNVTIIT